MPTLPTEILVSIFKHLPPLSRPSVFDSFLLTNIWRLILKLDTYTNELQNLSHSQQSPNLCLVGHDLRRVAKGNYKGAYLVLLTNDWHGGSCDFKDLFIKCLQDHEELQQPLDKYPEVKLKCGITIQIEETRCIAAHGGWIQNIQPGRLFRRSWGKLSTYALYYNENILTHLKEDSIRIIDNLPKKKAINEIYALKLKFREGTPVWRVFSNPRKTLRLINLWDDTGDIIGWRVATPPETHAASDSVSFDSASSSSSVINSYRIINNRSSSGS